MYIGQHRQVKLSAHFIQNFQTSVYAHTALGAARGPVGFVERAFVNEGNAQSAANFLQLTGHVQRHLQTLDRASPGDQKKPMLQPGVKAAKLHATTLSFLRSAW